MNLNLSDLLRKGTVEQFQSSKDQIRDTMQLAVRDVSTARKILAIDADWAYNIAFNGMLQAGRALMFFKGYRPRGPDHHLTVVQFTEAVFKSKFADEMLQHFERARRRRSILTYDQQGGISATQAETSVDIADTFVTKAIEIVGLPLRSPEKK